MRPMDVFGVHSGLGGHTHGAGKGPQVLKSAGVLQWLGQMGFVGARWHDIGHGEAADGVPVLDQIVRVCRDLADGVERAIEADHATLVLGGDHSCAVGTWSGAANALEPRGPLGLVWIDAHMDSHTPATTPSGNYHGMPVAHLLGKGLPALTSITRHPPAIRPEHLAVVGVRSFEPAEPELLHALGVRVFIMQEVVARGFDAVLEEAMAIAGRGTAGFGVSLDLDAIDPSDVPGTGSPVDDGISAETMLRALEGLGTRPGLVGLEIAEFNPTLDHDNVTLDLVRRLLGATHGAQATAGR
jgi:arginase